jgi:hypothetical protein
VLVDDGPECLEDHLRSQRGDVEVLGHQPVGHLAAFTGDGVGERGREAGDAVAVDVGVDVGVRLAAADGVDERRCDEGTA